MKGQEIGVGRAKIPIKSIMFAFDSNGVNIDITINLAAGNN